MVDAFFLAEALSTSQCQGENTHPGVSCFVFLHLRKDAVLDSNPVKKLEVLFLQIRHLRVVEVVCRIRG